MDERSQILRRGFRLGLRVGSVLAWAELALFLALPVELRGRPGGGWPGWSVPAVVAGVLLVPVLLGLVLGGLMRALPPAVRSRPGTRVPPAMLALAAIAAVLDQAALAPVAGERVAVQLLPSLLVLGAVFGGAGSGQVAGAGRRHIAWLAGEEPSFFLFGIPRLLRGRRGPSGPMPF